MRERAQGTSRSSARPWGDSIAQGWRTTGRASLKSEPHTLERINTGGAPGLRDGSWRGVHVPGVIFCAGCRSAVVVAVYVSAWFSSPAADAFFSSTDTNEISEELELADSSNV